MTGKARKEAERRGRGEPKAPSVANRKDAEAAVASMRKEIDALDLHFVGEGVGVAQAIDELAARRLQQRSSAVAWQHTRVREAASRPPPLRTGHGEYCLLGSGRWPGFYSCCRQKHPPSCRKSR